MNENAYLQDMRVIITVLFIVFCVIYNFMHALW